MGIGALYSGSLLVLASAAAWLGAVAGVAAAADDGAFAVRTAYLQKPLAKYRRITLEGKLGGTAKMTLDPNTCKLDEAGEAKECTELAPVTRDVRLVSVKTVGDWKLYAVEGTGLGNPLHVAVARGVYRLVYDDRGPDTPYPITLEPIREAK